MKPETTAKIKYGVWGLICGAVIAMIVGFAWGGWTTSSTSQTRTQDAVVASQAAICVAQFMKEPNHEAKLKELSDLGAGRERKPSKKGAGIRCQGKTRVAMRSPGDVPMGLSFSSRNERVDRTMAPARSASLTCSGSPRDVTPRSISRDRDPFDIQNKA